MSLRNPSIQLLSNSPQHGAVPSGSRLLGSLSVKPTPPARRWSTRWRTHRADKGRLSQRVSVPEPLSDFGVYPRGVFSSGYSQLRVD